MMQTHVDLTFVCRSNDLQAVRCLQHLGAKGYKVEYIGEGVKAPVGAIALYTGYNEHWPSRNFRVAAQRLFDLRPDWAVTTPFVVAIRPTTLGNMLKAAEELADMYVRWYQGDTGAELPWETNKGPSSTYTGMVEEWLDSVALVLGSEELQRILESQKMDKSKHTGRGGDVVFRSLAATGKVVLSPDGLTTLLPINEAYRDLTGVMLPPVSYGTSDIANLFELLQAIKLGYFLGLPVVFETYPGAHDLGNWLQGFMNPSLAILGSKVWSSDFTDVTKAKFDVVVTPEKMQRIIKSGKFVKIADIMMSWAGQPLWKIYQQAMRHAAQTILDSLGLSVDFRFTTTEDMCKRTGLWNMPLSELATIIKELAGHDVVVYNTRTGDQIKTSDPLSNATVADIHAQGGWLGGAALYYMVYHLSDYGGVVVMVKDSTRGRVNMMAKPFLGDLSDLRLAPVGLFRLSAEDQNEDWSIDPFVMMELMANWGPEKTAEYAQLIWESMEVPLMEEHIGRKTVAKVSFSGVKVRVQDT